MVTATWKMYTLRPLSNPVLHTLPGPIASVLGIFFVGILNPLLLQSSPDHLRNCIIRKLAILNLPSCLWSQPPLGCLRYLRELWYIIVNPTSMEVFHQRYPTLVLFFGNCRAP